MVYCVMSGLIEVELVPLCEVSKYMLGSAVCIAEKYDVT